MTFEIDANEAEALILACNMRIGYIETGRPTTTANDAINQGHPEWIKPLSVEQKGLVVSLHRVIKTLSSDPKVFANG